MKRFWAACVVSAMALSMIGCNAPEPAGAAPSREEVADKATGEKARNAAVATADTTAVPVTLDKRPRPDDKGSKKLRINGELFEFTGDTLRPGSRLYHREFAAYGQVTGAFVVVAAARPDLSTVPGLQGSQLSALAEDTWRIVPVAVDDMLALYETLRRQPFRQVEMTITYNNNQAEER